MDINKSNVVPFSRNSTQSRNEDTTEKPLRRNIQWAYIAHRIFYALSRLVRFMFRWIFFTIALCVINVARYLSGLLMLTGIAMIYAFHVMHIGGIGFYTAIILLVLGVIGFFASEIRINRF